MTFDAFISYSHADIGTAERLESALESFARPWYRRRSLRVFRDTSNLAAEPALWKAVRAGLDQSRHLIILASPAAANSLWVDQEVRYWLTSHPPETLIIVRLDGALHWNPQENDFAWPDSTALTPALRGVFREEPLWVDLHAAPELSLRDATFRRCIAQAAARIRGIQLDEILGEDLRRHRQTRLVAAAAVFLILLFAIASALAYRQSVKETAAKEKQSLYAQSRQLAALSREALEQRDSRLALHTALASLKLSDTVEARNAILDALTATRRLVVEIKASDRSIDAVALAADLGLLITGDGAGAVAFWGLPSGNDIARFPAVHGGGVTHIAISRDGRLAASGGGATGGFVLWDLNRLEAIKTVADGPGFSLAFSPNGQWLLAGGEDGAILAWDLQRGETLIAVQHPEDGTITDITTDASGEMVVTGSSYGVVRVLDGQTLQSVRTIDPAPSTGLSVDISSDQRLLIMAGAQAAQMWDLTEGEPYSDPFVSNDQMVTGARFAGTSLDPAALVVGSDLLLWSAGTERLGFHQDEIFSFTLDPNHALLATGARDGSARVWSLYPSNAFANTFVVPDPGLGTQAVVLSRDGSLAAVGASDVSVDFSGNRTSTQGVIYLFDPSTGEIIGAPLTGHHLAVVDLAFSTDGQLASASDDGTVRVWDLASRRTTVVLTGEADSGAVDVEFSPDNRHLALAWAYGPVQIWDLAQKEVSWSSVVTDVLALTFSPEGDQLAMGTADGGLWIHDLSTSAEEELLFEWKDQGVHDLAFLPEGRQLAALVSFKPYVVDLETGSRWAIPVSDRETIRSQAVRPGVAAFLTLEDGLSLWDLQTQQRTGVLQSASEGFFTPYPQQVTASGDGSRLAANYGAEVRVFNLGRAALETRVCEIGGDSLTREEWTNLSQADYFADCEMDHRAEP